MMETRSSSVHRSKPGPHARRQAERNEGIWGRDASDREHQAVARMSAATYEISIASRMSLGPTRRSSGLLLAGWCYRKVLQRRAGARDIAVRPDFRIAEDP